MAVYQESVAFRGTDEIFSYRLTNGSGMAVEVLNYGCYITGIHTPDRLGQTANVVLHYERTEDYFSDRNYLGCLVGRYANRISGGGFTVDGHRYPLASNDPSGRLHLHGGAAGFHKKIWREEGRNAERARVVFSRVSRDGEEGYPGNLRVRAVFELREDNALEISSEAMTDRPTVINLTSHLYFNLSGEPGTMLDHELGVQAGHYTPLDADYLPLGSVVGVAGTPCDLRQPAVIEKKITVFPTLNYCLDGDRSQLPAARLFCPRSGRSLGIRTTEPGLQVYFGNFLRDGIAPFSGVCLEPQHFPDSPNQPGFPSTVLLPGMHYKQSSVYFFDVI